jgi:hypothetical protein
MVRARELAGPGGAVVASGSLHLISDLTRRGEEERASAM